MHKDATNSRMKRDGTIGAQTETETETETRFWVGATACTRPAASGDTAGKRKAPATVRAVGILGRWLWN